MIEGDDDELDDIPVMNAFDNCIGVGRDFGWRGSLELAEARHNPQLTRLPIAAGACTLSSRRGAARSSVRGGFGVDVGVGIRDRS